MSIGPSGMIGSLAGSPRSQAKGTDTDRTQQDTSNQSRQVQADQKAENAAGIGETEQDEQTSERDADGRRLWEKPPEKEQTESAVIENLAAPPRSREATKQRGTNLDLSG